VNLRTDYLPKIRITNKKQVLAISAIMLLILLGSSSFAFAAAPDPTYASAVVDGNPGEWDLTADFFADMYRAGKEDKVVQSKLYLRYDLSSSTLYVLVLTEDGYPGLKESDEAWVKIDGSKMVDGTYPDFKWVGINFDGLDHVQGFEASFILPKGTYTLDVHINVMSEDHSETSRTLKAGLNLLVVPETLIGTTLISVLGAGAVFMGLKRHKSKTLQ
jgi:hypothetical protein